MALNRDDVLLRLGLDPANFDAGLDHARGKLDGFGGVVEQAAKRIEHLLEFEVVVQGVEKFADWLKESAEQADRLGKLAQKVGVPVEQIQRLGAAAKMADVSQEQLAGGLARLARNMADVGPGGSVAAEAFRALGIQTQDAAGNLRSTEAVFGDLADAFAGMQDGAGKTALSMMLFGRAGAELIPVLNLGRQGVERFADEFARTGKLLSPETIAGAEKFADTLKLLGGFTSALGANLAASLSGPFQGLLASFTEGNAGAKNMATAVDFLSARIREAAGAALQLESGFARMAIRWGGVLEAFKSGSWSGARNELYKTYKALEDEQAQFNERWKILGLSRWGFAGPVPAAAPGAEEGAGPKRPAPIIGQPSLEDTSNKAFEDWQKQLARANETIRGEFDALVKTTTKGGSELDKVVASMNTGKLRDALQFLSPQARDQEIEALLNQAAALDEESAAAASAADAQKRLDDMMRTGAEITRSLRTPSEEYAATVQQLDDLLAGGAITWDTYSRGVRRAQDELEKSGRAMNSLTRELQSGLQGSIEQAFEGGRIEDSFARMLKRLAARALAEEIVIQLGFKPQGFFTSEGGSQGLGALWRLLGMGGGAASAASGVPYYLASSGGADWGAATWFPMAEGGAASAGNPYLIGERGPELFVPSTSGTILPNDQLASGAAAGETHLHFHGTLIDRRAAEDFARQYRADLLRGLRG